jgi:hypothetical protein
MSKEQASNSNAENKSQLQVHVNPELEYKYRDFFSVFVSNEDVVIEFGNRHRSMPNNVTVSDRIVLSIPNSIRFINGLQQSINQAREQIQKQSPNDNSATN